MREEREDFLGRQDRENKADDLAGMAEEAAENLTGVCGREGWADQVKAAVAGTIDNAVGDAAGKIKNVLSGNRPPKPVSPMWTERLG